MSTATGTLTGQCLCGTVTITATQWSAQVSACHCRLCRVWSGGVQFGFDAPREAVTVTGTVRTFRSSSFAERAFCQTCGTSLWLRDDNGPYEFVPGFFDGASELPLVREVYADRAFACATLVGDHPRVSRAEYEATQPHVEDQT